MNNLKFNRNLKRANKKFALSLKKVMSNWQ